MRCGVGCRRCRGGSDPASLWLWRRLAATASIGPLAWELPHAAGAAQEMAKKQKNKKTNKQKKNNKKKKKFIQDTEEQDTLPNSFYEVNTIDTKPDTDTTKEIYRAISSVNINAKILNKILAN